ncbi:MULTISPECIES: hypothetical protein [unclassified Sphingobium]|uniref:hypothetical protein n=1 Tax=unclassified Sphingobium TaxID=2611147 RepID=UPI000D469B98|nr:MULTISPECIES: hypothetical protein [unclassified Sphingobium]MBG6120097.1 hypothetical protein [Sphingobium sp. JAI105]PSO12856.1 hypothetical protein C7E20_03625 [Sphingobium sp. AEW4]TWD05702.1 hypothetical protein FB595_10962 [Sphingobium sp. AEW010]TWD23255.1 hypothetical protein FB596_10962 [Sphingobium sp. AEW013]TWD25115.1 hypothetical protein FB594_10962 [Sphingobium sp. AEW001]
MPKLGPDLPEIAAMRERAPAGRIAVVNLLKFKPGAEARQAYARYMRHAHPAAHPDCTILHAGPAFHEFGTGEEWDYIIIAGYPCFEDFAATVSHDAWQTDGARHRPDALERTLMIVSPASDLSRDFPA